MRPTRHRPRRWFFDAWAAVYDFPPIQRMVYRPPHDAVLAALRDSGCRRVLDVGCGTGRLAARLRQELPGTRVVGCDFLGRHAETGARVRPLGILGPARRWPPSVPGGRVDAVVSTEAFHWFPDQRRALAECRRVLRPQGRLLLALASPRSPLTGRIVAVASRAIGQPFYWPSARELQRLVQTAGFRVERQTALFRLPAGLLLPPVLTVATVRQREREVLRHVRRAS